MANNKQSKIVQYIEYMLRIEDIDNSYMSVFIRSNEDESTFFVKFSDKSMKNSVLCIAFCEA